MHAREYAALFKANCCVKTEYKTGARSLETIFKQNELEIKYDTKYVAVCVCVYLDRILENCNREDFSRHGTEEQPEVFMYQCVCRKTEKFKYIYWVFRS